MNEQRAFLIAPALTMAVALALMPASVVHASPGLTKLGQSSGGYSFVDAQRTVADPGAAAFVPFVGNPVISGPNLYAPSVARVGSTYYTYFGGFNGASEDSVYLQTTTDGTFRGGYSQRYVAVPVVAPYEHANDASVIYRNNTFTMALTTAVPRQSPTDSTADRCSILTSSDGINWPSIAGGTYQISISGASVPNCARPSLIFNETSNKWELYFDAELPGQSRQLHLAVSTGSAPVDFVYAQPIAPWVDADIKRLSNGSYIAAYRSLTDLNQIWSIRSSLSTDGRTWTDERMLLQPSPLTAYDDCGVTNPGWVVEGSTITALLYGGTQSCNYDTHKVGVAYPQSEVTLRTGTVLHGHRQAMSPDTQIIDTHNYPVDGVQVRPAPGAPAVIDQAQVIRPGDVWSLDQRNLVPTPRSAPIADSPHPSLPPSNATDGDAGTFFSSTAANATTSAILALSVSGPRDVRGVSITPRPGGLGFPIDFEIQWADESGVWRGVPGQNYIAYPNPGASQVLLAFVEPVRATDLRIAASKRGADDFGNFYLQIAEINPTQ